MITEKVAMELERGFVHASMGSLFLFVTICIAIVAALLGSIRYATRHSTDSQGTSLRWLLGVSLYLLFLAAIVQSGLLQRHFIPLGPLFLLGTVSTAMALGFTRLGRAVSMGVPLSWLVAFQGFRLPLELILHDWYSSGTIPETMTWTGSNWDIVSGILASLAFPFAEGNRWLAWFVNIVGIALLVNVGRVAIMSSAVPFGWKVDPPLELILYLPYAFIVPVCVGGAALGHVMLTRRLLAAPSVTCLEKPNEFDCDSVD